MCVCVCVCSCVCSFFLYCLGLKTHGDQSIGSMKTAQPQYLVMNVHVVCDVVML